MSDSTILYNGTTPLNTSQFFFQTLLTAALKNGSNFTLDVKFITVTINVDPKIDIEDAEIKLEKLS
ncbi:4972_t:CDS:2 [Scutellospora calospora]|uniref:4972_t:CDS:1 n=1 Tax=Scutellospora calospora TaxID=85575 RepID=A0ACA9K9R0_9GLOM|nr:4972_t:CDS:2 [Scutellospora calospora]